MDTTTLHAALLGIFQGFSEFLPISSSAHLIVLSWMMDGKPLPLTLNVALHVGTALAVLAYFWRDWLRILQALVARAKGVRSFEADTLFPGLLLGSIPAGIIGGLWNDDIEARFHHPATVIVPMALIGLALWLVDKKLASTRDLKDMTKKDAFLIGVAQTFALIPGFSRSGSTIIGARLLKINREDAARFSFMLGTPAMCGAAVLKHKDLIASAGDAQFQIGAGLSFVVGCLTIGVLLKFLKRYGFAVFAAYRVAFALFVAYLIS
jgi:undecaprenyl-diphosphatase